MNGNNDTAYRQHVTVIVTAILLALSTLVFALRLIARSLSRLTLQVDDYLMGVGVFLSWGIAISIFVSVHYGLGEHESTISKGDLKNVLIAQFALQKFWAISMCFVKCSILTLYMRIFQTPMFRRVGFGLIAFSVCWALSGFLGNLLQCIPPNFFYDKSIKGECIDPRPFFIAMGSISFVEDVAILSLPMPMIWKLSIDLRRKLALTAIFLLGAFVCITSILRLTTFNAFRKTDVTYTNVWPGLWTYIELSVGSICGSLPLLRPIVGRVLGLASSHSNYENYQSGPYGRSGNSRNYNSAVRDNFPLSRRRGSRDLSGQESAGIINTKVNPNSLTSLNGSDELELVRHAQITVHTEIRHESEIRRDIETEEGSFSERR